MPPAQLPKKSKSTCTTHMYRHTLKGFLITKKVMPPKEVKSPPVQHTPEFVLAELEKAKILYGQFILLEAIKTKLPLSSL